jgi:spermidine/putrescine transport system substrate-binding protein
MSKSNDDNKPISAKKFMKEFRRYQKGSITRRHFLGVTGLGTAMAVMGATAPSLWSGKAHAAGDLGDRLIFSTWPNYHDQANLDEFTAKTGVNIQIGRASCRERV